MDDIFERRKKMQEEWEKNAKQCEWRGDLTMEEINKHNTARDCWVIIDGTVYDFTQYVLNHPGGSAHFTRNRDISRAFHGFHQNLDLAFVEKLKIGRVVASK